MATHEARRAMCARRMIGATLAACALTLAAPAGVAAADPSTGPGGGTNDPAIADYTNTLRALTQRYSEAAQSGNFNQQQFTDDLNAANSRLSDALLANTPGVVPGR
jgi:hypothetical protein